MLLALFACHFCLFLSVSFWLLGVRQQGVDDWKSGHSADSDIVQQIYCAAKIASTISISKCGLQVVDRPVQPPAKTLLYGTPPPLGASRP